MAKLIQSIRGMHDLLPEQSGSWGSFESQVRTLLAGYGYSEIRMPIVESTDLFKRSIGDVTDIVEKEMYSFDDRNGENLTLRPEGTAGCVRACIQNGLLHNQQQRLWYHGPMFRHERPQKGRYRQFHQIGVEVFGIESPEVDAELIALTARLWKELGISDVRLELNSLGSAQARADYRDVLVAYFSAHPDSLDEDSQRRLQTNPLRILDTKNPAMRELVEAAPSLADHLDEESKIHFAKLRAYLDTLGIAYTLNPRLVRGLDYYGRTVFEWVTESLGAQGTICAGGRYDGLVEQLGGKATPAVGFAMGVERIIALLDELGRLPAAPAAHAYLVMAGEGTDVAGVALAESLRDRVCGLRLTVNAGGGSFKAQMKRADKSGAELVLVLGEEELAQRSVAVKSLRDRDAGQQLVSFDDLHNELNKLVAKGAGGKE